MSTSIARWETQRALLEQRLVLLIGRERAVSKHLRGEDGRHDSDFGDRANFTSNDEVLEGLEEVALAEIRLVRAALDRIDKGVYDECATCGDNIAEARVKVVPHTRMCIECAADAHR